MVNRITDFLRRMKKEKPTEPTPIPAPDSVTESAPETMTGTTPSRTFRLVTVNTAPERAKLLIGRMIKGLEGRYTVEHVANCSKIEEVSQTVKELQPDILFSASMWTPEQAKEIREIAERERPGIKTHAIPEGLQVARGPDGVVEYLLENVPGVLDSIGQ